MVTKEEAPRWKSRGQGQQWAGVSCKAGPVSEGASLRCRPCPTAVSGPPGDPRVPGPGRASLDEKRLGHQCHQRPQASSQVQGLDRTLGGVPWGERECAMCEKKDWLVWHTEGWVAAETTVSAHPTGASS